VDVGAYRDAMAPLGLGDVTITEVFDPTFAADQNVAMIRIQAQDGEEAISPDRRRPSRPRCSRPRPGDHLPLGRSVGPKVSGELIRPPSIGPGAIGAVLVYIWLRFEWQFALGAVAALVHDVILTIGVFSVFRSSSTWRSSRRC
jgi:preprotein translocase subunit SecF